MIDTLFAVLVVTLVLIAVVVDSMAFLGWLARRWR